AGSPLLVQPLNLPRLGQAVLFGIFAGCLCLGRLVVILFIGFDGQPKLLQPFQEFGVRQSPALLLVHGSILLSGLPRLAKHGMSLSRSVKPGTLPFPACLWPRANSIVRRRRPTASLRLALVAVCPEACENGNPPENLPENLPHGEAAVPSQGGQAPS